METKLYNVLTAMANKINNNKLKQGTITFSTSWNGSGPYTQVITVTGVTITNNSKVDLQFNAAAINALIDAGVTALWVENNAGILTAYAIGAAPSTALTAQCTVMEVAA